MDRLPAGLSQLESHRNGQQGEPQQDGNRIHHGWLYLLLNMYSYLFYVLCVIWFCDHIQNRRMKPCLDGSHVRKESQLCGLHESHLKFRKWGSGSPPIRHHSRQHINTLGPISSCISQLPALARQYSWLRIARYSPRDLPNFEAWGPSIAGWKNRGSGKDGCYSGRFWMVMMLNFLLKL